MKRFIIPLPYGIFFILRHPKKERLKKMASSLPLKGLKQFARFSAESGRISHPKKK
jgi:hypothetical protein